MAWTTPKTFTAGERLFASDLNTYVSDNLADLDPRTVKTFADASARTSGITSPTEGMLSYLADTNAVEVYDGSAWTAVGADGIGSNVVQAVKTDTFTTTSTSFVDVTDLEVTITPSSATSKVLVVAHVNMSTNNNAGSGAMRLTADGSAIYVGDAGGSATEATYGGVIGASTTAPARYYIWSTTPVFLHSPATTSPVVYKVQVVATDYTVAVNQNGGPVGSNRDTNVPSSLTAIEVAA